MNEVATRKVGRPKGISRPQNEASREKIQSSQIINALQNHVFGKNKMTASQVSAGLGLLRKTMPDLQMTELSMHDNNTILIHGGLEAVPGGQTIELNAEPVLQIADNSSSDTDAAEVPAQPADAEVKSGTSS